MRIEAGRVYRDSRGILAHIMGPVRGTDYEGFWSLEGDHYSPSGFSISTERTPDGEGLITRVLGTLVEELGVHSDAGRGEGWAHSRCSVCMPEPEPVAESGATPR